MIEEEEDHDENHDPYFDSVDHPGYPGIEGYDEAPSYVPKIEAKEKKVVVAEEKKKTEEETMEAILAKSPMVVR